MFVERLLQVNIAALAALSALLLGMGERSALLPLGMLVAAFASVWLTDATGFFRLNRRVTSVAALLAVLLSTWEVLQLRSSFQVMAIANLLVYLQVILLFQEKEYRTYWQLIALSLLQVVIAAAFNQGFFFGLLLVVYLGAGLSAMALLTLHHQRRRYAVVAGPNTASAAAPLPTRWPLAGQQPAFTSPPTRASARETVGRELWGRLAWVTLGTLGLAMVAFFAVPRLGRSAWHGSGGALRSSVGFSDKVTLGELGKIIENRQEVLRIHFLDEATRQPYKVHGEVYLRGAVLAHYRRGRWYAAPQDAAGLYRPVERGPLLPSEQLTRQVITIEPMDRPELFCVWPFVGAGPEPDPRILFDVQRQRLLRSEEYTAQQFTFELATPALASGVQSRLTPSEGAVDPRLLLSLPPAEGRDALPGLVALARTWLGQAPLAPDDRVNRARLLERMLRDSGRYQYSLEGQPRDRSIDPIEDFITKHPRGHCEYFATALVLMLRSQGIPARLVVGFKTDEWNDLGGFFQARQLHAHTWVEVYLGPRHLPQELIRGARHWEWADGGWLRLDPTPPASDRSAAPLAGLSANLGRYLAWADYLWDKYVVEMDSPRQRETIYRPVIEAVEKAARRLTDPTWWRRVAGRAWEALWAGIVESGIRWVLVGACAVMAALAVCVWCVLGRAPRSLFVRREAPAQPPARDLSANVEFFRRLETLLARHGLTRPTCQTHRQFARQAGEVLARSTGQAALGALPPMIAEAFYRVRFGRLALDPAAAAAIEAALEELDRALRQRP